MEKKSFRPKKPASPTYPVFREVDHTAMTGWGLAALGGLLLGGAACTPAHADQPPPGEPPAVRVERKPDGKAVRSPDAGAPETTTVLHAGRPTAPRVDEDKPKSGKADKSAHKKASKRDPKADNKDHAGAAATATTNNTADAPIKPDKPSDKARMMGKMRMPRADEVGPEEKKKPSEK